jgi:glycosyltransferase involved in cell wall biosynthesis
LKTIWLINQYASLPHTGQGGRHRHLARELAKRGHKVSVIAARWTHYLSNEELAAMVPDIEDFEGFRFVRIPVARYSSARDWRRILNWFIFALRLGRLPALLGETPDHILYSSPSLIGFLGAERLARRSGARLTFEVRDIWPLTLVEIGGYSPGHPFIRFLQWIENRAYARSDRVISNLPGAVEHMVAHGLRREKFAWIPNGFSLADVERVEPLTEALLARVPKGKFIVGYAGTMGVANGLITLIGAAESLRQHGDIAIVMVGKGQEKNELQAEAERRGLNNVVFLDHVEKNQVLSVIELFDVCYIGWKVRRLYEFGVAPNKIFDYFCAGKAVINAYSGAHDPVTAYSGGVTVPAEDPEVLAEAVLSLRAMPADERARLGESGRAAILRNHEYAGIAAQLERVLVGNGAPHAGMANERAVETYTA